MHAPLCSQTHWFHWQNNLSLDKPQHSTWECLKTLWSYVNRYEFGLKHCNDCLKLFLLVGWPVCKASLHFLYHPPNSFTAVLNLWRYIGKDMQILHRKFWKVPILLCPSALPTNSILNPTASTVHMASCAKALLCFQQISIYLNKVALRVT